MFDSIRPALDAIESKIPVQSLQRDALVRENVTALKAASTADHSKLPGALASAEQLLGKLQQVDGGANSNNFKQDLGAINSEVNPVNDHGHQYLPFLQVLGVTASGRIQVNDITDGKRETLVDDHNLLEPTAPSVKSNGDQLYYGADQKTAWRQAIKPGDIQQGRLGDCYFLASLQSVAASDPESIRKMIHDNGTSSDGKHTYTVTFPGAKEQPVTVSEPNSYDVSVTAQNASGLWANVLEKAHRELTGKNMHDDGGDTVEATALLTGKQAIPVSLDVKFTGDELPELLSSVKGRDVTAETSRASTVFDAAGNKVDIIAPHAYSFVNFDAKTQMVTLSNPQDLNPVEGEYRPESTNIHRTNAFDGLLNKTEPGIMKQPATGRLVTMRLTDFAASFDKIVVGQY